MKDCKIIKKCSFCGCEFETNNGRKIYCSDKCNHNHHVYKTHYEESEKLKAEGVEGVDYVIDQWNGFAVKRMYGMYMKFFHPDKTTEDYLKEFPDAKLWCDKVKKAVTKNSGKHMKTEKYKQMFSEKMKGDKNPNHKNNTTEEERKSRSPFCNEFYETHEGNRDELMKSISEKRTYNTRVDYYIELGYSEEEAQTKLKERQTTFTKEKCIGKYGETKGVEVFEKRQKLWSEKVETKYRNGEFSKSPKNYKSSCFSNIEKQFIEMLIQALRIDGSMFKTYLTKQLTLFDETTKTRYHYDFCYGNKIIEFNGDYWHCNPKIYNPDYYHKMLKCTANEVWERNQVKINHAKSEGYSVLIVWENDFMKDADSVIKQCLDYIFEK